MSKPVENQNQDRTDIEKLAVLLPYWLNHNNDHIRDQEKWLKKAEKERLIGWLEDLDELDHLMLHIKGIPHEY